ncbi:carbonic anhydrase [Mycobacterium sp.]|uniref:carbonic anhydrase n=1 Tax=Mycobacterium sp. TaxID=1785 RepID=UPI0031CE67E2
MSTSAWSRRVSCEGRPLVAPGQGHPSSLNALELEKPPSAVVFACAEAATPPAELFDGDTLAALPVSTWGHAVGAGVLASVEYAVGELGVSLVVVLGHPGCSALRRCDAAATGRLAHSHLGSVRAPFTLAAAGGSAASAPLDPDPQARHVCATALRLVDHSATLARLVRAGCCAVAGVCRDDDGGLRRVSVLGHVEELPVLAC